MENNSAIEEHKNKYLLFKLGHETYATPLLGVREVVEYIEPKPVPNLPTYFKGIINIRGEVLGILDLKIKFCHKESNSKSRSILIVNTEHGALAVIVDSVDAVISVQDASIEKNPVINSPVPPDCLIGMYSHSQTILTLINLNKALSSYKISH